MSLQTTDNCEQPRLFKPADGVFVRIEIDNMGWLDMGGYTIVVDSLEQARAEPEVVGAIEQTVGTQPIRYLINTHTHPDHIALNRVFRRMGAEIINAGTFQIPVEGLQLEGDKRSLRVWLLPGCHSRHDCVVWLPGEQVLFVGDLFGWGLIPWMGNLKLERRQLILDTYQKLLDCRAKTVIPGHGPPCTSNELARWRDYFLWLIETVEAMRDKGYAPGHINRTSLPPPEDMVNWWRFVEWKHDDSLRKVVKAVFREWR